MSRLPTLKPKEVVAALQRAGFGSPRQKGSHYILVHSDGRRTSVPVHGKDLKRGTMFEIIKQAGLTQEEFAALL